MSKYEVWHPSYDRWHEIQPEDLVVGDTFRIQGQLTPRGILHEQYVVKLKLKDDVLGIHYLSDGERRPD